MAELTMHEQEIVNATCLSVARQHGIHPESVEVELAFDDNDGFSAAAYFNGRTQILSTFDMIQAIRLWLDEILQEDAIAAGINLKLDDTEGIIADIK